MKKFFYLIGLCLFASVAVSMTSCSKDDKEEKPAIEMSSLKEGTTENGNTIQHVFINDTQYVFLFTATLDSNNKCESFLHQIVYVTVALAQENCPTWQEEFEDPENVSIKSNVITWDRTASFKGQSKQDILDFFENW